MIKEALQYIVGLNRAETIKIGDRVFIDNNYRPLREASREKVELSTLTGLIDIINAEDKGEKYIINVKTPATVEVITEVFGTEQQRDVVYEAYAELPKLGFGYGGLSMEAFLIELQSKFVETARRNELVSLASHIYFNNSQEIMDDGISQTTTVRTGVTKLENIKLPNPVALKPYRTFYEVEQPESSFVFRIDKNGNFNLIEADGGAWKIEAMQNVKEYLQKAFEDKDNITVVA